LLTRVHQELSKLDDDDIPDYNTADVHRRLHQATIARDPVHEMAAVVRWATNTYMDFLYLDPALVTQRAKWGLECMDDVTKCLKAHWTEVCGTIERNNLGHEYRSRITRMQTFLYDLLKWLYKHHAQVLHSLAGLEELLLVGEEIDFVERSIHNHGGIHQMYSQLSEENLPMVERLQAIGKTIRNALKHYNQPMPLEYAFKIMARVMPKLDIEVMESLPLKVWTGQLTGLGLIEIRDKLEADVTKALASRQAGPPVKSTSGDAVSAWMDNAPIGGPRSELGSDGQHIVDQVQASFGQEPRVASPLNSLFSGELTPRVKTPPPLGTVPEGW
jgi:hypothetical protein